MNCQYSILPTESEIKVNSQARYIPLYIKFMSDSLTPIALYTQGRNQFKSSYILESVEQKESVGRYSFVGLGNLVSLISKEDKLLIFENQQQVATRQGNIYAEVQKYIQNLSSFKTEIPSNYMGFVGYFSYDMIRQVEVIPNANPDELGLPETYLILPQYVAVFDHFLQELTFITYFDTKTETYAQASKRFSIETAYLLETKQTVIPLLPVDSNEFNDTWESNMTKEEYCSIVAKAKEYIKQGDVFQVVLSQRFALDYNEDSLLIYRMLRYTNPSPYLFYLSYEALAGYDAFQVAGSSPEVLVIRNQDQVILKPIAGTRKRGKTKQEDIILAQKLLDDPKEVAEHMMLVDLGRNDLGRFCLSGSIEAKETLVVEYYSHVIHLVSSLEGKIDESITNDHILMACLPAGTLSGAPKIRAMEIIDELETEKRGVYAGSVLQWGFDQTLNACIAIRCSVISKGKAYVQAGAGIVADSNIEKEYEETRNKAKVVMQAIQNARVYGSSNR